MLVYQQQQVCIQSVTVVLDEDVSRQITLTREGEVIIGVNPAPALPYVDGRNHRGFELDITVYISSNENNFLFISANRHSGCAQADVCVYAAEGRDRFEVALRWSRRAGLCARGQPVAWTDAGPLWNLQWKSAR